MTTNTVHRLTALAVAGIAVTALGLAAGVASQGAALHFPVAGPAPATADRSPAPVRRGPEPGSLEALRAQVRRVPADWPAWSAVGALELERGRATGDPSAYAAAQTAFARSLTIQPTGNDLALAGQAALAASRHDFALADQRAHEALAVNPSNPQALAALTDALTELGRYDEAFAAATRLDATRPGVASFTRLSYQAELRGRTDEAIALMSRASGEAGTPAEVAFTLATEGMLRLANGDRPGAARAWSAGTAVAPDDVTLALLGARLAWAQGDREVATRRFADLMARSPTPAHAVAAAEVFAALGRTPEAEAALDVARAGRSLARGAGVAPDAGEVLAEADHGDPRTSVTLAAEVWRRTPSVVAADAYAWALHSAGRDAEALPFADRALSLDGRPAGFLAHRGTIRAATGDRAGAVTDLRAALATDPTFSPLHAPRARGLLQRLEVAS